MKRLNLKNGFVNRIITHGNETARFVYMILIIALVSIIYIQSIGTLCAAVPVWNGTQWCSYFNSQEIEENGWTSKHEMIENADVYMPCQDMVNYEYKTDLKTCNANLVAKYKSKNSNCENVSDVTNTSPSHGNKSWTQDASHILRNVPENTYQLTISRSGGSASLYIRNVTIPLKYHIRFDNGKDCGSDSYSKDISGTHTLIGTAQKIEIPFRSFLTKGNITVTLSSGDPNVFRINNQNTGLATIALANNSCGIMNGSGATTYTHGSTVTNGAPGNASLKNIEVWFYPNNTDEQNATLTFFDGTTTVYAYIKAKGEESKLDNFGTIIVGQASGDKPFKMTDFSPNNTVTLTPPAHFQVSTNQSSGWSNNSITINGNSTFYVRFAPTNANTTAISDYVAMQDNYTHQTYYLKVEGTAVWPSIAQFPSTNIGTCSTAKTWTLNSILANGNVTVTAPNGYLVSNDGTTWQDVVTVSHSGSTTIRVKYVPNDDDDGNATYGNYVKLEDVTHKVLYLGVSSAGKPQMDCDMGSNIPICTGVNTGIFNNASWNTLKDNIGDFTSATIEITNNSNNSFMLQSLKNAQTDENHQYVNKLTADDETNQFRLGYFPNAVGNQSCTIKITAIYPGNITKVYTIQAHGSGKMQVLDFSGTQRAFGEASPESDKQFVNFYMFRASYTNSWKVEAPDNYLLSLPDSNTWTKTINVIKPATTGQSGTSPETALFLVRFVPKEGVSSSTPATFTLTDNSTTSHKTGYKFQAIASATAPQTISFDPTLINTYSATSKPFTFTNFEFSGDLEVTAGTNFAVSTTDGNYAPSCTITRETSATTKTIYIKFYPKTVGTFNESIQVKDKSTDIIYSIPVYGKGYNKITFPETKVGETRIDGTTLSGTYSVTAPDGYLVSPDNGATWCESFSNRTITSLKVKYQPHDGTPAGTTTATITVIDNNNVHQDIEVEGTKGSSYTITPEATYIGLARDKKVTLDNFTVSSSATISIIPISGNNPDFYLNTTDISTTAGIENPANWSKTDVSLTSNQFLLKFQPSDVAANRACHIRITDGTKTYTLQASGTGTILTKDFGSVTVGNGSYFGFMNTADEEMNWYYFKNRKSGSNQFKILKATFIVEGFAASPVVKPTVAIINRSSTDFALNTSTYDCGYSVTMNSDTSIVRVGFTPHEAITNATNCTIQISANGKTYTYLLKGKATEPSAEFTDIVKIGKASGYKSFTLGALFRPSWGGAKAQTFTVTAPTKNYLFSENGKTWTNSLTFTKGSTAKTFYVKLVPEESGDLSTDLLLTDNGTSNRGKYHFSLKGSGDTSMISLNATVQSDSEAKPFSMDNFSNSGALNITLKDGTDFVFCETENGEYQSSLTLSAGKKTFYVKQLKQDVVGDYSGTIQIEDVATTRKYDVGVNCTVAKYATNITVKNITLNSNDRSVHEIIGVGNFVCADPAAANDFITLSFVSGTNLQIVDNRKIQVIGDVSKGTDVVLKAMVKNHPLYADDEKEFHVSIYKTERVSNDLAWVKDNSGSWYVVNLEGIDIGQAASTEHAKNRSISVYIPNVQCTQAKYGAYSDKSIFKDPCPFRSLLYGDWQTEPVVALLDIHKYEYKAAYVYGYFDIPARGDTTTFTSTTDICKSDDDGCKSGNIQSKYAHIQIPLSQHYDLTGIALSGATFSDVEVGEVAYRDILLMNQGGTAPLKSFLTTNGIKIEPVSECPDAFFVNPDNDQTQTMTLVPANSAFSPYTPLSDNSGLVVGQNNNYYIRIYFKPKAAGDYSGTFKISDGSNMSMTFTVTGNAKVSSDEPQTIAWDQDLSGLYYKPSGSNSVQLNAKSTSGMDVTYSGGSGNIQVSTTGTLTYTGSGSTTITASCPAGSKNGVSYTAASVTRNITVLANAPTPTSDCSYTDKGTPSAWNVSTTTSPYSMTATEGFEWDNNKAYKMTFNLTLTNCATATVKLYVNGTDASHEIYTYTLNGNELEKSCSIDLTGLSVVSGSKFYCSFDGTIKDPGYSWSQKSFGFRISDVKVYYSASLTRLISETVSFGEQRVGQSGVTKNIEAISYTGISGKISASITGDNADCFVLKTIINPATRTVESCKASGKAAYDVQFLPNKAGTLNANLHITDPVGDSIDIPLSGTASKRDTKVSWSYDKKTISLAAVGSGNVENITEESDRAFIYDKLRNTTAKLTVKPTYTVVNVSKTMFKDKESLDIIRVETDNDGNLLSIKATGYGTGTAKVVASYNDDNNDQYKKTATEDNCTLTVNVNKVTPTIVVEALPTSRYLEEHTLNASAVLDNVEIKDIDNNVIYALEGGYGKLSVSSTHSDIIGWDNTNKKLKLKALGSSTIKVYIVDATLGDAISNPVCYEWEQTVDKAIPTLTTSRNRVDLFYPDTIGENITLTSTNSDKISWKYTGYDDDLILITPNGSEFNIKPKEKKSNTTITFTCVATKNYEEATITVDASVDYGEFTVDLHPEKLPTLTSATVIDLSTIEGFVTNSFYSHEVQYLYSLNTSIDATITGSVLSVKEIGSIKIVVNATHTLSSKHASKNTDAISCEIGTLQFLPPDGSDNKWSTKVNWAPHHDRLPDAKDFNVLISAPCVIDNPEPSDQISSLAIAEDVTTNIVESGNVTIAPGNSLTISDNVVYKANSITNNAGAAGLVLKATPDHSATVIFTNGNNSDNTIDATVKMFFKGHTHEEFGGGYKNPEWQYRGLIGNQYGTWPSDVKVFKWDEKIATANQSRWVETTDYKPWAGYCMANLTEDTATYSYTTKLIPIPESTETSPYTLTYTAKTSGGDTLNGAGVNILTNSFSAPLQVCSLNFVNMNAEVFFFKNDYYLNWKKSKATAYVSCPSNTCGVVCGDGMIPAGHGFLVQADATRQSSLTIPASAIVKDKASGPYYAPAEKKHYNVLSIRLSSDSIDDELFLLENETCSRHYDNGYDGTKMFAVGLPQIYANNRFGKTSINADSSMLGQYIGFTAIPELTDYELKFDIDRLEGFTELYLYDHLTKRYADILAGGTYHFTATAGDDPERFQIMGKRDDGTYFTGTDQWIEVVGQRALLHGFDDESETISITDLTGRFVWSDNSKNGPWFDLPDLPAGIYFVHCGKATAKFIAK